MLYPAFSIIRMMCDRKPCVVGTGCYVARRNSTGILPKVVRLPSEKAVRRSLMQSEKRTRPSLTKTDHTAQQSTRVPEYRPCKDENKGCGRNNSRAVVALCMHKAGKRYVNSHRNPISCDPPCPDPDNVAQAHSHIFAQPSFCGRIA
jgi:hypothetical protein